MTESPPAVLPVVLPPVVFLPGILMPATARYAALRAELTGERTTLTKELEVYAGPQPPAGYSIQTEVDGLHRFADQHQLDTFHLYGHSAGAVIALVYATQHPDRVLSLALDEPASDLSDDDRRAIDADLPADLGDLPLPERMARFAQHLVRPGVELPAPSPPGDDPEMAKRPAGLVAFSRALHEHVLDHDALRAIGVPVYFSYGSLSNERWEAMAHRFERELPDCTVERYDGLHHLWTSHLAEPARVAASLEPIWSLAESSR